MNALTKFQIIKVLRKSGNYLGLTTHSASFLRQLSIFIPLWLNSRLRDLVKCFNSSSFIRFFRIAVRVRFRTSTCVEYIGINQLWTRKMDWVFNKALSRHCRYVPANYLMRKAFSILNMPLGLEAVGLNSTDRKRLKFRGKLKNT